MNQSPSAGTTSGNARLISATGSVTGDRFTGKRALITGGSRGIGAAIARRLAAEGASVAVTYLADETSATRLVDELRAAGQDGSAFRADVTNADHTADLREQVLARYGGVDVVASSAGIEHFGALNTLTMTDFDRVFHTNVAGQLLTAQAFAPVMPKGGRILLMSSISARIAVRHHTLYAASKAAVSAMVLNLALELAEQHIAINALAPGATVTDMAAAVGAKYTPISLRDVPEEKVLHATNALGRLAEPTEIAAAAAFLLSPDATYITGATLDASGGWI